ncbi:MULTISPECIES: type II secretion system protein [unclassified Uliginosibacterium]|uniref:type II secretion system protein n=1 Tax=unclassified Uliginosibacterium TaxID=2621521 RepID=UPI000C7CCE85|nr:MULTISPECIES: prepilin-type N-terminal cleavage/methylation domain-containing protein [unclassified Uliginosibacterium]MDO6384896.1 prepilin-type N-terminal cleavage/methylation domain-containing protein [Uliginosibacterium sp. 31-12]PLK48592.1 type II secretion system protein [Uliginosibacterium sp. TH139]
MRRTSEHRAAAGFTLIEMIVVMTITAILVAIVAVFIRRPMEGLVDTTRRAALADAADTALRRMAREIRAALPNSLRVAQSGSTWYIEFLPVLAAGRYCEQSDCGSTPLDTVGGNASLSFAGPAPALSPIPAGTEAVIYNLGVTGLDAYAGGNSVGLASIGASSISFSASKIFTYASPGRRVQLIGPPVSYACSSGGTLSRIWGYTKQASQPVAVPANASTAVLADFVASCAVDYTQSAIDQNGLLYLSLQLARAGETVSVSHAIQINNTP